MANPIAPVIINSLAENCKRCTKSWKEPEMLPISHAILYLCRSLKNREADYFIEYLKRKIKNGFKLEIPEWAIDGHTEAGRKLIKQKNIARKDKFYKKGALLDREKELKESNVYKKKLYDVLEIESL